MYLCSNKEDVRGSFTSLNIILYEEGHGGHCTMAGAAHFPERDPAEQPHGPRCRTWACRGRSAVAGAARSPMYAQAEVLYEKHLCHGSV